jgi:hypothetical protein
VLTIQYVQSVFLWLWAAQWKANTWQHDALVYDKEEGPSAVRIPCNQPAGEIRLANGFWKSVQHVGFTSQYVQNVFLWLCVQWQAKN